MVLLGAVVGMQDWANKAVARLESLEQERMAIQEHRASSVGGDNERRLDAISKEVDALYAKLNTEAEQIAVQVETSPSSSKAEEDQDRSALLAKLGPPAPPPPPGLSSQSKGSRSIDTVVVEHRDNPAPEQSPSASEDDSADAAVGDAWLQDERLQLSGELKKLALTQVEKKRASEDAGKSLENQAQELVQLKAQAQAARLALRRVEETQASAESQLLVAQERLAQRREMEKRAKLDLAAMEAKVRTEFKLLAGLDKVQERISNLEQALQGAVSSAEQERASMANSVDQALDAAERATRQAEEMRDAAERAHHRAQQAIAHAQEVESRSEAREQELLRVIDGLEGQMAGLNHERTGIEEQLSELRRSDDQDGDDSETPASGLRLGLAPGPDLNESPQELQN